MKTDELINMLGTNLEPVRGGELRHTLMIALAVGAVLASCLMLAIFGAPAGGFAGLKILVLAFTLGLVVAGARFLIGSARPGEPGRKPLMLIGVLFLALASAGGLPLVLAHPAAWSGMIFGPQWAACLICLTGDVYRNALARDGSLARWSWGNKVAAAVILAVQAIGFALRLSAAAGDR